MKETTKNIHELLSNKNFKDIVKIKDKVTEHNLTSEHNECTVDEAITDAENIRDSLLESIDQNIFDMLGYETRNRIFNEINSLNAEIDSIISNNTDNVPQFIDKVQRIKDEIIFELNIDKKSKGIQGFRKKITELSKTQQEYNKLVSELRTTEGIYDKTKAKIEEIEENYNKQQNNVDEITKLLTETKTKRDEVEQLRAQVQSLSEKVDTKSSEITKFHSEIKKHQNVISQNEQKVTKLVADNETLQEKSVNLLGTVTGGALGNQFATRKEVLIPSVQKWKRLSNISVILFLVAGILIYFDIIIGGETISSLFSKLAVLIPLSLFYYFASSNYAKERHLLEEYAFKSTVSLSIDSYKQVLEELLNVEKKPEEQKKVSDFVIESMKGIYTPPVSFDGKRNPQKKHLMEKLSEKMAGK